MTDLHREETVFPSPADEDYYLGINYRDYLIAHIVQGMMANPNINPDAPDAIAKEVHYIADCILGADDD